jgi:AmmeMemoRadiSam system protein A
LARRAGEDDSLSGAEKTALLDLAQASLAAAVEHRPPPPLPELSAGLRRPAGAFVTLTRRGRLRGCIGLMQSEAPLGETVAAMAESAAVHDARFAPVSPAELPEVSLEISVLSPLKRAASAGEIELGTHGVLVRRGRRSGVFLPQVAQETGWSKARFLSELCASKAGLEPDAWQAPDCELYIFTVELVSREAKPGK